MAWVKEASGSTAGSASTCSITVPAGGFPVGHLLVLGVTTISTGSVPGMTTADLSGNTWTQDRQMTVTGLLTASWLFRTVVTTALNAGDTITVTASGTVPTRWAMSVQEFDDSISGLDTGAAGDNGGVSSSSVTSGNFTTTNANTLIVGVLGLVSASRILTPGSGYTAGTKVQSTNGTGDRATVMEWKTVSSTGSYAADGTLNTGSVYTMLAQSYVLGAPPARSGKAKVWDGSAWVSHPAKVWDGSSWVTHPAKAWDGSSWIVGK